MDVVDEMGNQLFLVVWMGWEEMHGDGCYQGFFVGSGFRFSGFWVLGQKQPWNRAVFAGTVGRRRKGRSYK